MSRRARFLVFAVGLAGVLALLVAAAPGMPAFGGASHPYRDRAVTEALARHTANAVSSVNFDQRALDTLGEEVILLASVLAASVLLRPARDERVRTARSAPVLPTTALLGYLLLPVTLLIGLDVVTHGAVTPGGGFQGGVVLATGIHLLYLAGSYPALQRVGPARWAPAVEALGVCGFVLVGPQMETEEKGLYAIGDIVAGLPQLAHAAMMEGIIAVTHIAGKPTHQIVKTRIPNATYCEPQIGSIGLTEKQARDAGYDVKTGKFPFVGNSKATILGNHGGFVKVVSDEQYGEVLGIHIIGPLATEILAEAATVLKLEGTIEDMMNMVHAHPTVWEAMGDAFASVRGLQINV